MTERNSPLAPFQNSTFRAVWIASLASNLGSLIQTVGAAWTMTAISDSASLVALVQASTTLPIMLLSLPSGALADSFNRRKMMLVAQCFMLAVSLVLTIAAYLDALTPWTLLTFTFLIGCGTALNNPSWQASVGDMVPRADLPAAVALNSMGFNLTRSVGPAIGGAIVAAAGGAAAFAVNTTSYLALIFVLFRWRPTSIPSQLPRETMGRAMLAGVRYVAMSPNIKKVLLRAFVFGFSAVAVLALLPLVARDIIQGGPLLYGVLFGAFGIGAVGGALSSGWLRQHLSSEWCVRLAFAGFALCAATAGLSTLAWLTCLALALGGASWVIGLSLFNVTVQMSTPRWVVGRALALYQTATFGGMAIGSWTWGMVAEHQSPGEALVAAAVVMVVGAGLGLRWFNMPDMMMLNLDPLNRWKEPHIALDLQPRSGPVVVKIEYVIREEDTAEFLTVMAERRRIRRRDGARHWRLARDLENPEIWMETYDTPTWVEYIRHNQRMTHADAAVSEKIRRLHSGTEPPRVQRLIERPTDWTASVPQPKTIFDLHH